VVGRPLKKKIRPSPRDSIILNPFQQRILDAQVSGARETWAIAGNRSGKSLYGAMWAVVGALSDKPDEVTWVCCESSKVQREGTQKRILEVLADVEIRRDKRGHRRIHQFSGKIDRIHTIGGVIQFRNYCDGAESATAASAKRIWFDEEAPLDYYSEAAIRTIDTHGRILATLTAVNGRTPMLRHILEERTDVRIITGTMRDNADNLPPGAVEEAADRMKDEWEREVRINGRVLPLGGRPYVPGDLLAALSKEVVESPPQSFGGFDVEIIEGPNPDTEYSIGIDAAEGVGRDQGGIVVSRSGRGGADRIVAVLGVDATPSRLSDAAIELSRRYNNALTVPEANGPGLVVIGRLVEAGVPVLRRPDAADRPPGSAEALGFLTTRRTRTELLERLRSAIVGRSLEVRSRTLIDQLGTFVWGDKRPEAAEGYKDDVVIAACLSLVGLGYVAPPPPPERPRPPRGSPAWHLQRLNAGMEVG